MRWERGRQKIAASGRRGVSSKASSRAPKSRPCRIEDEGRELAAVLHARKAGAWLRPAGRQESPSSAAARDRAADSESPMDCANGPRSAAARAAGVTPNTPAGRACDRYATRSSIRSPPVQSVSARPLWQSPLCRRLPRRYLPLRSAHRAGRELAAPQVGVRHRRSSVRGAPDPGH